MDLMQVAMEHLLTMGDLGLQIVERDRMGSQRQCETWEQREMNY